MSLGRRFMNYVVLGFVVVGLVWLVLKYGRNTGRGLPDAARIEGERYAQLGDGDALGAGEEARANGARRHRHGSPQ